MVRREAEQDRRAAQRPRLTRFCEQILVRTLAPAGEKAAEPLSAMPRSLLVVKVFGMGDSVLVRSILERLHDKHPEMSIGVLVGPATRELMTLNKSFRVHEYAPRELSIHSAVRTLTDIRRCRYEAILNFEQRSLAGSAFLALAGAPYRIGFVPIVDTSKARFLTHTVRFRDDQSVWQSFIRLAQIVDGCVPDTFLPKAVQCSDESQEWAREWWARHIGPSGRPAMALHVGSRDREFSRWPLGRFIELAERFRCDDTRPIVILTGTAPEKQLITEFMASYSGDSVDASESGSLMRTASLLSRCNLLVSNDTGVMHLGAALGVPTVGLFGPNSPRYWAPLGPRATYVYDTTLPCSPCLNLYADRWPLSCSYHEKGRCMSDITVESVISAAKRVGVSGWRD